MAEYNFGWNLTAFEYQFGYTKKSFTEEKTVIGIKKGGGLIFAFQT